MSVVQFDTALTPHIKEKKTNCDPIDPKQIKLLSGAPWTHQSFGFNLRSRHSVHFGIFMPASRGQAAMLQIFHFEPQPPNCPHQHRSSSSLTALPHTTPPCLPYFSIPDCSPPRTAKDIFPSEIRVISADTTRQSSYGRQRQPPAIYAPSNPHYCTQLQPLPARARYDMSPHYCLSAQIATYQEMICGKIDCSPDNALLLRR
ncbi:unnamed protein product [Pleuronectes platessa]|uniref:Uncharacterized protein n=1 Tax=Pleuronectes platessa TaxID=8262 RepID=A0A9N7TY99_PLEPL|nr:unnamed protein product [Pleuronectes platessa]